MFPRYRITMGMAAGYCLLLTIALSTLSGCSRTKYRRQADREVRRVLSQTAYCTPWKVPYYNIYADPSSRYYDPYAPDREPMPHDDPYSHQYMLCVDGKRGYKHWLDNGITYDLENPRWLERIARCAPITESGAVKLDVNTSLALAYLHSRDYRDQIETLYLSAIDVTAERFRFDTQFFGGNGTFWNYLGKDRAGGESAILRTDSSLVAQRRLAAGGTVLAGFANTFLWQFTGPDSNSANSLINFSIVQPLLRGGGRAVNLETLTIAERSLLANLRAIYQYRQGFYTDVAIGQRNVPDLRRRGGLFGGSGITGFTGVGAGGFGGIGAGVGFGNRGLGAAGVNGGGAGAGFAGGGAGTQDGFIGLIQQQQQIRNLEAALDAQLRNLRVLEANFEAGLIDLIQVDEFRQSIETNRASLLTARNGLQASLDDFKTSTLSLPPNLKLELEDGFIRQFQFVDPLVTQLEGQIAGFVETYGEFEGMPNKERQADAVRTLSEASEQCARLIELAEADLNKLDGVKEARMRMLNDADKRVFEEDIRRLGELLTELTKRLESAVASLESMAEQLEKDEKLPTADDIVTTATGLISFVQEISLVQARARLEAVYIEPLDIDSITALEIARRNRLDWMNNRAGLVDTWRLITFNANALRSNLNIVADADIGTVGDNPVKFQASNSRVRAGVQFDAPLTRLLERNNYRQILINYQQGRRSLMEYEDQVHQTLRALVRQLKLLEANMEIQRRSVIIAVRRVDQTRESLNEPPGPTPVGQTAQTGLGETAALRVLQSLADLRSTQDNFMSVWLAYYATRMSILREMGILELDECGRWIDMPFDRYRWLQCDIPPLPPNIPLEWINEAGALSDPLSGQVQQFSPSKDGAPVAKQGAPDGESGAKETIPQGKTSQELPSGNEDELISPVVP